MSKHRVVGGRQRWQVALTVAAGVTPLAGLAVAIGMTMPSSPYASAGVTSSSSVEAQAYADASRGPTTRSAERSEALPKHSGHGRRAVFSPREQRVWLVRADGSVKRTYLVSGSVENNLRPGRYHVFSRSRQAWGIDDSGTMRWFVRFAYGTDSGAPIGFHSIPMKDGAPLQTRRQLGTPRSHGCIRQRPKDARAMWTFAHLGTKVVVLPRR